MFGEFSKAAPEWITVEIQKARILESPLENLKEIFSLIAEYQINGIIIEDIDALLTDLSGVPAAKRVLLEGIKKLGDRQLLVATTRNPTKIEDAILSDFDDIIPFYYPSESDRCDILRIHTQVKRHISLAANVNLSDVAKRTSWFSGADLENIIVWSSKISGEVITLKTINEAIDFIGNGISVSKRVQEMKDVVEFAINHCTINTVREELLSYAGALNILQTAPEDSGSNIDLNKLLELKPNFFGLGLNLNEVIETIRRKLKKKKE